MKDAKDLIPWKVTDISVYPYGTDYWSMNPSIHLDKDGTWRCVTRIVDYAMPGGVTIRNKKAGPGHQTRNAMIILDPNTWKPIQIFKMRELDEYPRTASANVGFEDMRIFKTDRGGLQGIAASLHLKRDGRPAAGGSQHQPPEQVLLSFDDEYNIINAKPIRGAFSGTAQKNWAPFHGAAEPRFLYAIDRGTMFDDRGPLHGSEAVVRSSVNGRPVSSNLLIAPAPSPSEAAQAERERKEREQQELAREQEHKQEQEHDRKRKERDSKPADRRSTIRGGEVSMVRGRRVAADTLTSRPSSRASARPSASKPVGARGGNVRGDEGARTLGTGRTLLPKYAGLRGGTQLVRVGDDAWLGIGHEMRYERGLKFYFHTWYSCDSRGKLIAASPQMKFAPNGIEFAAGMGIDGDKVVVSFGVDDMECKLGITSLSAVMEMLIKVQP